MITAVVRTTALVEQATEILAVIRTKARVSRPASAFCSVTETDIWFPVPPNTTTLPPPPAITTNPNPRPPNAVEVPPDFDDSDLCYIFQDLLPDDSPPVYAEEMEPAGILEPYTETVPLVGRTRLRLAVREYPYALVLPTEEITAVVRTVIEIPTYLVSVEGGAFSVTGQAAGLYWNRKLAGEAGTFALSGFGSGFIRDYLIGTNAGTFVVTGQDAGLRYDRLPLAAEVGEFVLQGQDAGWFLGKTLAAEAGSFTLSGEAAGLSRPERVVTGDAGAFTLSGQTANFNYTSPQFAIATYTGNGTTTNAVTGIGFTPGFVWTKRINSTSDHNLHTAAGESISGSNYFVLQTNNDNAAPRQASPYITFDSGGFTLKSATIGNVNTGTYIAWCWKAGSAIASNTDGSITANVSANAGVGISHLRYTGTGANGSVGHGLGVAPDIVFFKNLSAGGSAPVAAGPLVGASNEFLLLSSSASKATNSFMNTTTTSSVVNIGASGNMNSTSGMIAIAFASISGYSKHSTYSGNGSATQAVTGLGFQPSFVIVKSLGSGNWVMFTAGRDGRFIMNTNASEAATDYITFDSDGFTLESGAGVNSSGVTYLYMAFA